MSTSLGKDSSEAISWLIEGDAGGADGRKLQPLTACLLIRSVKWKTSQVRVEALFVFLILRRAKSCS
jgi:hypothetical protein